MQVTRDIRDEKLDFWIENNLNVLFIGHYGAGKTTRILDAFKRNKLNFKYFSAATMDPWCDFIGVPKVMNDSKGAYLDYILPRDFRDDNIEAIYMDEFNRSHKKVRNAVLELLQFKTINGRPFNKLKIIWAAINPEDEGEYQVDALDKAQKDRFHVQIVVPYEPSLDFFLKHFTQKQAKAAVSWWQSLNDDQKMEVSPRRLEYALKVYNIPGGQIKDVLPHGCNPAKLINMLKTGPIDDCMKEMFVANNVDEAKRFLQIENNFALATKHLCEEIPSGVNDHAWRLFFLQVLSSEKLSSLIASNEAAYEFILNNADSVTPFSSLIRNILNTNTDKVLVKRIKKEMNTNQVLANTFGTMQNGTAEKPHYSNHKSDIAWLTKLAAWGMQSINTTPQRLNIYSEMRQHLPAILTTNESIATLELLNLLCSRSHSETLKQFPHLMGVINHCIDQINKKTNLGWSEILASYGEKFDKLLSKIREIGFDKKLLCPIKQSQP